ncbi:hypothetical protein [Methylovulum psychrotolerans]|uniref:Uncharacterized protein n=1 Tax=Methylovulum psychrotolerans TaxID=1704499 RepID=A0A1Z4BYF7_9GAMM|nr:hypothetical protein [Methylovulum psychrotolerans]ASF46289.1 hypothetical protein CEK71_09480 [Methylovulum psychrotolerans]POZ51235.1 hypothetical protein AADEFJLK_03199 [Methylovulum psychrotolerans]
MSNTNTSCTVTNSISIPVEYASSAQTGWDGSIVAINAYNTGSNTYQGYAQTLALLPFASGSTLPESSTSTITLDQTIVDNNQTIDVTLYDLIFAQANNLFPAFDTSEMLGFVQPYSYPPITVTTASSSSCANALLFYQNICAFPSSTLAKNFTQVLNSTNQSSTSASGIDSSVNQFFAGTQDYQNVTFDSYIAVTSYLSAFAFAWANFAASYTYYMYKSSGNAPSSGTNPSATSLGTITFTQTAGDGIPSLTDYNGGYTIVYTDTDSNTTTLYFSAGQLVSSTTEDIPLIALQCSYVELSQFSGNASDAATIVPILAGSINGVQAIGIYTEEPDNSNWLTSIENFFNSSGMQLLMQILGVIMGLKLLYEGLSWLKGKFTKNQQENNGEDPNEQQVEQDRQEQQDAEVEMQGEQQEIADRLGPENNVQVPEQNELADQQNELQQAQEEEQVEEQIQEEEEQLNNQAEELEELAEVGVNEQMEEVANNEREEMEELENINPQDIQEAQNELEQIDEGYEADSESLANIEEQDSSELSESEQESIDEAEQAQEEEAQEQEEEEKEESEAEEGDDLEDLEDL